MRRLRLRDDNGIAMVTALLATMVVSALAVAGFSLSQHTLDQSANDRRAVQAIHAAEAGIDAFLQYLTTAPSSAPLCTMGATSLTTTPASSFTVTAAFIANGSALTCSGTPSKISSVPTGVVITSDGTSSSVTRRMQGSYALQGVQGGYTLYNGAVYADGGASFSGQASMQGKDSAYGADLVSNGSVNLQGGGNIYGNVYTQGALSLGGGTDIKQDAISKLALTMSGGSIIRGNARSSTAGITVANNSTIGLNAYYCTGSAPGTGTPINECNASLPSTKTWTNPDPAQQVKFTYTESDWTSPPDPSTPVYKVKNFSDCGTATKNFIENPTPAGNWVVRINSTCQLSWGGQSTVAVKGNLAIISDGSLALDSHATFTSSSRYSLFLIFNYATPRPCNSVGISLNAQAMIASTLDALLYTPCQVTFGAQSSTLTGQIVAGSVSFGAGSNITTVPVKIPGSDPNGFQQTMQYRREIAR